MSTPNVVSSPHRVPRPGKKYFDIDEANRAIGYVSRITRDLMACYRHVVDIRCRVEHMSPHEVQEHLEAQYETAMEQLGDLVDELQQIGVELKDFEKGRIDFPAIYGGREIYFAWQYNESKIVAWHEIDAGFSNLQNVGLLR